MALSYLASSTLQAGTTSFSIGAPTGTAIGDLEIIHISNKLGSNTPTTPTNWTLVGTAAVGTGADGAGTGQLRVTVFARVWDVTPASVTVAVPSGNSGTGGSKTYRKAGGDPDFIVNASFGSDTTSGTAFATTQDVDQGFVTGDQVFIHGCTTTNTTRSGEGATVPGCTIAAVTGIESGGSATGNDQYAWTYRTNVTAGSQTGPATTSATLAAASTGGAVVVRISIAAAPLLQPIIVMPPRR